VTVSGEDPVSIAMDEISDGKLSFVKDEFDAELAGANSQVLHQDI
jgi:DNA-directed RNA polymerase subunit omega